MLRIRCILKKAETKSKRRVGVEKEVEKMSKPD